MKIRRLKIIRPIARIFVLVSLLVGLVITILPAPKAEAILDYAPGGGIPASVYLGPNMTGCAANTSPGSTRVASQNWISLYNQSTVQTYNNFVIGTTGIAFDYNATIFKCHTYESTGIDYTEYRIRVAQYKFEPCSSSFLPFQDIPGLVGSNIRVDGTTVNNIQRYNREKQLFFINTSSLTTSTTVCIRVGSKQYNRFSAGAPYTFSCLVPSGPRINIPDEFGSVENCPTTTPSIDFQVNVSSQPNIPSLNPDSNCKGLFLSTDGARVDVYGPSGFIGTTGGQAGQVDLAGIVNPGTALDVYAIAGAGQSANKRQTITWTGGSECDFKVTPAGTASLDDSEDPVNATFGASMSLSGDAPRVNPITITPDYYYYKSGTKYPISPGAPATNQNLTVSGFSYSPWVINISGLGLGAGDKVCSATTVSPAEGTAAPDGTILSTTNPSATSTEVCAPVTNKPYLSVYSGDVFAGGNFGEPSSSCETQADINTYNKTAIVGSGSQLAVTALGIVNGFNSANLRGSATNPSPGSGLTFANNPSLGTFKSNHCIHDYFAEAAQVDPDAKGAIPPSLDDATGGDYYYPKGTIGLPVTLTGGTIGDKKHVRIFVDGDVAITNNIYFSTAARSSRADIPSLVIVARNIYIGPGVSELNGVFVAQPDTAGVGGTISTCANGFTTVALDSLFGTCNQQLNIFGSFIAKEVKFKRTYGSLRDGTSDSAFGASRAAEVFRFTPELFVTIQPGDATTEDYFKNNDFNTVLPPVL